MLNLQTAFKIADKILDKPVIEEIRNQFSMERKTDLFSNVINFVKNAFESNSEFSCKSKILKNIIKLFIVKQLYLLGLENKKILILIRKNIN